MEQDKTLYIACALRGAPQEFIDDVAFLQDSLHDQGINILKFVGLGQQSPLEIFEWDILECVSKCDLFLGIYGYYSDGRGVETSIAWQRGIPMLGVALEDADVSKVILGGYEHYQQPFLRVSNLRRDVPALVQKHFHNAQLKGE